MGRVRRRRPPVWVWPVAGFVAVFAAGTAAGFVADAGRPDHVAVVHTPSPAAVPSSAPAPPGHHEELLDQGFHELSTVGDGPPVLAHRFDVLGWVEQRPGEYLVEPRGARLVVEVLGPAPDDVDELAAAAVAYVDGLATRYGTDGAGEVVARGTARSGGLQVAVSHAVDGRDVVAATTVVTASAGEVVAGTVLLHDQVAREDYDQMLVTVQDLRR